MSAPSPPARRWTLKPEKDVGGAFTRQDILRWIYLGRSALVLGVLLGTLWVWVDALPEQTFLATVMFLVGVAITGGSAWWTEVLERTPSRAFLVSQVAFDAFLVTGVVHITGGGDSTFAWLYILVISEGALLLPLAGGVLISALASILYFADIVWGHSETLSGAVTLQIGLFAVVAILTGLLGDRLRRAGMELGEMQSELRRLRLDTSEILASISTGVVTVDQDQRLVYINPAGELLLDIDARQWRGAPIMEPLESSSPQLAELLVLTLEEGKPRYRRRAEVHRRDEVMMLGVSAFVRDEPDEPRSVTAIFQDITDLERMAVLNRRAERLEAVAELSAAMAHEIKNPLASIRSAVEQFASPRLDGDDREVLTRMVVRESERLSRLLSDFLDFSRVRLDRVEAVPVGELVSNCVTLLQQHPATEERGVEVTLGVEDEEVRVRADADLIHRALFNLVLNAVQFSPQGGRVHVGVDDLREGPVPPGIDVPRPVRIRIRDQGPGIPEEEADRIFDPFFTTREGGTGLGLAVVHRTVEAHRGVILVDGPPEGGTEFQIFLPSDRPRLAFERPDADEPPESSEPSGSSEAPEPGDALEPTDAPEPANTLEPADAPEPADAAGPADPTRPSHAPEPAEPLVQGTPERTRSDGAKRE